MKPFTRQVSPSKFLALAEHTYLEPPLQDFDVPQVKRLADFLEAAEAYDDAFRLRWMIHKARKEASQLIFHEELYRLIGLAKSASYGCEYNSARGLERPVSSNNSIAGKCLLSSFQAKINPTYDTADECAGRCLSALEEFTMYMSRSPSNKQHTRTQLVLECNAVLALRSLGYRTDEAINRMRDRKQQHSPSILSPPTPSAVLFGHCATILRQTQFQQTILRALEQVQRALPSHIELGHAVPSLFFCYLWSTLQSQPHSSHIIFTSWFSDCSIDGCPCHIALSDLEILAVIAQMITSSINGSGVWLHNTPTLPEEILREALSIQQSPDVVRGHLFTNLYLERLRNKQRGPRAAGLASGLKGFLRGFLDEHFVLELSHVAADALGL